MADVFISYKSERRPAISHIAQVIENYGYSVWFDYALMSGGSFSSQIERELRAARPVIVVWCSLSTKQVEGKTNWVLEEADLAKELGTYLPVWIEPAPLPLGFRTAEAIDIEAWNGDPRSHDVDRLNEQISIKVKRDPAVNYKALVAQSAEVRRSGLGNLAAYPLDKQGSQLAAQNREREQRKQEEASWLAELKRQKQQEDAQPPVALSQRPGGVEDIARTIIRKPSRQGAAPGIAGLLTTLAAHRLKTMGALGMIGAGLVTIALMQQGEFETVTAEAAETEAIDTEWQYNLGSDHYFGDGGYSVNKVEAARLFRLAADQGYAKAQTHLGAMYANGEGGLAVNKAEAVRLFLLAADQGEAFAQYNLGLMHQRGEGGLAVNMAEAVHLYRLAAAQGDAGAKENLERLAK